MLLAPLRQAQRTCGPASRKLISLLLDTVPRDELSHLRITVRAETLQPGQFPRETPASWHTDYGRSTTVLSRLKSVHTYAISTAEPRTLFFRQSEIWLPSAKANNFNLRMVEAAHPTFSAEPWSIVRFNATELHTAVTWTGPGATSRLFVRATYDPFRG